MPPFGGIASNVFYNSTVKHSFTARREGKDWGRACDSCNKRIKEKAVRHVVVEQPFII